MDSPDLLVASVSALIAACTRSVKKLASRLGLNSLKGDEYMSRATREMVPRGLVFAVGTAMAATVAFAASVNASLLDDTEYETVFDGTEASFDENWKAITPASGRGGFLLPGDGTMRSFSGGLGGLWLYMDQYGDFSIKLEWRDDSPVALRGNSGVLVRFPTPSTGLLSCLNRPTCGYEVQINDSPDRDPRLTGSIYGFQDLDLEQAEVTPRGTWNTYEILAIGQHYTVTRNGEIINDYLSVPGLTFPGRPTDPGSAGRLLSGYIGFQAHGDANDVVSFRNIQIRAIPEPSTAALLGIVALLLVSIIRPHRVVRTRENNIPV